MIVLEQTDIGFDANHRPVTATHSSGTINAVVQTSYDALGRPECVAQRMNAATWLTLPASACTLQSASPDYGPDRIIRTVRNAAGETIEVRRVLATGEEAERIADYSDNGRLLWIEDGMGNRTSYAYDGHDRLKRTYMPLAAPGVQASNAGDYEELGYDAAGNVTTRRNRAGEVAVYTHDALGRTTFKNLPGAEPDVTYGYDLLGRMTSASQPGHAVSFAYDALGRLISQTNPRGQLSYGWDAAGRRTRITWPDGYFAHYDRLVTGEVTRIVANQGTGSESLLGTYGYDVRGRRTSFVRAGGSTDYTYPSAMSARIEHNLPGTHSVDIALDFNPAGQIVRREMSNDAYAWTGDAAGTTNSTANGLNQLATLDGAAPDYDARGNMIRNDAFSFGYDSENRMTGIGAPGGALAPIPYDPLGRLVGDGNTSFLTDPAGGDAIVGEYWSTGFIRYVPGAGVDEPIAYVRSNGLRRDFYADERGSVIAVDEGGGAVHRQVYDEYGRTANQPYYRFGYTGQARLTRDLHYYKARIYWGAGGRFLQTDPIGYGDGMNLYAYVGGDPVNRTDPSGMCTLWSSTSYNEYKTLSTGGMIFTKEVQGPAFYTVTDCEGGAGGGVGGGFGFGVDEGGAGEALVSLLAAAAGPRNTESVCPDVPQSRPIGTRGRFEAGLRDPTGALIAHEVADVAAEASSARFPNLSSRGTIRDAYRHFYWSFAMTRLIGASRARAIGNANEVGGENPPTEQAMDTWNNHVGIAMQSDPRYANRPTAEVAELALQNRCLRTVR